MPSTPDSLLKLELQASGEHPDTWGDNLNATISLIAQAIAGRASIATTGGTTTLTDTQYATNQDRMASLDFSGVLSSNAEIIVPARTKSWIVRNQCSGAFTLTVRTSAGTGVVVSQGQVAILWCDGTNVVSVSADATTLGGIAAASFARRDAFNSFQSGEAHVFTVLSDGATITVDASTGKVFAVTLGGDRTLALSNPVDGSEVELYVTQDGTGGRTLTLPGNVLNSAGITLASTANATTLISLRYRGSLASWYAQSAVVVAGGSSTIADVTITGSSSNVDAYALAGSPAGPVTFTFTVEEGVTITSLSPASPALDFDGFASGSTISIVIAGLVQGAGGDGGAGGFVASLTGGANILGRGRNGSAGGPAIRLPSTSGNTIAINITSTGRAWGGGGGGGGGGATADTAGGARAGGGGGGGGAGGGRAGQGGTVGTTGFAPVVGAIGAVGSVGRSAAGGDGGGGAESASAEGGDGGDGGDPGTAGSAGTAPTGEADDAAAGSGGAAGKAIDYNGGSTPSYVGNTGSPYIRGLTS